MLQVATVNLYKQHFSGGPVSSLLQQRLLSCQRCEDEEEKGIGVMVLLCRGGCIHATRCRRAVARRERKVPRQGRMAPLDVAKRTGGLHSATSVDPKGCHRWGSLTLELDVEASLRTACGLLRFPDLGGELEDNDLGDDVGALLRSPNCGGNGLLDDEGSVIGSIPALGATEEEAHAGGEE